MRHPCPDRSRSGHTFLELKKMTQLKVKDKNGAAHTVEVSNPRPLMEVLRDANLGVQGTCGGACSCGTCHVYITGAGADALPPRTEDEQMMLEAIADLVEVRPSSRLSCQLVADAGLANLDIEIGPVA